MKVPKKRLPLVRFQHFLPQPDRFWGDLDQLILADELDGLFEVQEAGRDQADGLIGSGGAHVGELFFLDDVDVQVSIAGVLADDHALVDFGAGSDEHLAALLQVEDRVTGGFAGAIGDKGSGGAGGDLALPFDIAVEERIHDGGALGVGEHLAAEADQAARGHVKLQANAAGAVGDHSQHLPLPAADFFDHDADKGFGAIDHEEFEGLAHRAVDLFRQDFGLAHGDLVAFAAHHLDQDSELELAAAHYLESVRPAGFLDADGDVGEQLLIEAIAQVAGGDVGSLAAGEGRGVDGERHGDGGLIDLDVSQRLRGFRAGHGLTDGDALDAGDREDVARPADGFVDTLQAFERV